VLIGLSETTSGPRSKVAFSSLRRLEEASVYDM